MRCTRGYLSWWQVSGGTKRFLLPPLSSLMSPDINMNALASLLSLDIAQPELGKGKCLRVWHFYWISARFFASWAGADVYTHITNRSPAPHFNEPSGFVEENMRGWLWENTLRWWELAGEAEFIAGLSVYWCCDRIPDRGTWTWQS